MNTKLLKQIRRGRNRNNFKIWDFTNVWLPAKSYSRLIDRQRYLLNKNKNLSIKLYSYGSDAGDFFSFGSW